MVPWFRLSLHGNPTKQNKFDSFVHLLAFAFLNIRTGIYPNSTGGPGIELMVPIEHVFIL